MSPRPGTNARVVVHGHRQGGNVDQLKNSTQVRKALNFFADELRTAVGTAVYERIREGRWHQSRDDRFRYFRTWSKYRYGSSRQRTRIGSRFARDRSTKRVTDPSYKLPQSFDTRNQVDLLKFNFLIRALNKQAVVMDDGSMAVGPRKALLNQNGPSSISEIAGAYDVSSALTKMTEIQAQYAAMMQDDSPNARARAKQQLQRAVHDFLHGEYDENRFFKETKLGQMYLRRADLAAMRHSRNQQVLDPASAFYDQSSLSPAQLRTLNQRGDSYRRISKDIRERKRGVPTLLPAGSMAWGFETGTLARSWRDAREQVVQRGRRYRIVIAPANKKDGRNPSPLMLTEYLKRNIRKQGGTPQLLNRDAARKTARQALQTVRSKWAAMGIHIRGGFSKGGR